MKPLAGFAETAAGEADDHQDVLLPPTGSLRGRPGCSNVEPRTELAIRNHVEDELHRN